MRCWGDERMMMSNEKYKRACEMIRTMRELRVPSSTTCVLTMALPRRVQNVAATRPAWMAVNTDKAVEPCCRKEPVVRSCKGRVSQ